MHKGTFLIQIQIFILQLVVLISNSLNLSGFFFYINCLRWNFSNARLPQRETPRLYCGNVVYNFKKGRKL